MAEPEPDLKKRKLVNDPIFDEFIENTKEMKQLGKACDIIYNGYNDMSIRLLEVIDTNARSCVSFTHATCDVTTHMGEENSPVVHSVGTIFTDGIETLRMYLMDDKDVYRLPKESKPRRALAKLLKFILYAAAESHTFIPERNSRTMFQCEECRNFFNDMDKFKEHPCTSMNSQANPASTELSQDKGMNWNSCQTRLLIQLYQDNIKAVESGKTKKKTMWDTITHKFREQGYSFSAEQISGRWKSIMRAYKSTKDNNKKSGSGRKTFEFEKDLDEMFANDPAIEPVLTLSSSSSALKRSATDSDEPSCSQDPPKRRPHRSNASDLVDLFKTHLEYQKERDNVESERREQMHTERIQVMNSLIKAISNNSSNANHPPK